MFEIELPKDRFSHSLDEWQWLHESEMLFRDDQHAKSPCTEASTPSWAEYVRGTGSSLEWDPSGFMLAGFNHLGSKNPTAQPFSCTTPSSESRSFSSYTSDALFVTYESATDNPSTSGPREYAIEGAGSDEKLPIDRVSRRKHQNRASQRRFRASKEAKIRDFQDRIKTLEADLERQIERNNVLERDWERLKAEIRRLSTTFIS